jgi:excinuclease UvrABC nuclease subunit
MIVQTEEISEVNIHVMLNWTQWYSFVDIRNEKYVLSTLSGVYEVRDIHSKEILHIGKAINLKNRVKTRFVDGKYRHSTRDRMIEKHVKFEDLEIRWLETEYSCAVEEYLHKEHIKQFGRLPEYVIRT